MIDFDDAGNAIVRWKITGAMSPVRKEIAIPLSDYLALVKSSSNMEELRVMVFSWKPTGRAKSAGVL